MHFQAAGRFFFPRRGCRNSMQPLAYRKSLQPGLGKSFTATPREKNASEVWEVLCMN